MSGGNFLLQKDTPGYYINRTPACGAPCGEISPPLAASLPYPIRKFLTRCLLGLKAFQTSGEDGIVLLELGIEEQDAGDVARGCREDRSVRVEVVCNPALQITVNSYSEVSLLLRNSG